MISNRDSTSSLGSHTGEGNQSFLEHKPFKNQNIFVFADLEMGPLETSPTKKIL